MITDQEKKNYLQRFIDANFIQLVDEKIYCTIYDFNHQIVACTNQSAQSIGYNSWQDLVGITFSKFDDAILAKHFFKDAYNEKTQEIIHTHVKRIYQIQKFVLTKHKVVSFFDLLPYNNVFKSYLITYVPIYHKSNEVLGINSFAIEARFLNFQEYMNTSSTTIPEINHSIMEKLSIREQEIMFLLANGVTQEQIAQILGISRSTVATIIANQLCTKFGISGSSTQLLTKIAIKNGYYQNLPHSLWRPIVIILDEELAPQL